MKRNLIIVLIIGILYSVFLLTFPNSGLYRVWEKDVIEHYSTTTSPDTRGYAYPPEKSSLRTIGYPTVLKLIMHFDNWILILLAFNCLVSVWFFYVTWQLIGRRTWILFFMGVFALYIPEILTDLLFATVFVTAIWQIKRLWLHFLLLGVASLLNPALAWFWVIEPFVLYFNGYKDKIKIVCFSALIVFVVTSFNPLRNLINTGQWTHSTVMMYNIDHYFTGILYFFKGFYHNALLPHSHYLVRQYSRFIDVALIAVNVIIWIRFLFHVSINKINWGYVLILIYILGPTLFAAAGPRKALPFNWILLM